MILATPSQLRALLARTVTIAVVGASNNPLRPSYTVFSYLRRQAGYVVVPINPTIEQIDGIEAVPSLTVYASQRGRPDLIDIFRKSSEAVAIVNEAILVQAKVVWFQYGVINPEAIARADEAGFSVVVDRCLKVEHARFCGGLSANGFNSGLVTARRRPPETRGKTHYRRVRHHSRFHSRLLCFVGENGVMRYACNVVGACLSAALLAACAATGGNPPSSMPILASFPRPESMSLDYGSFYSFGEHADGKTPESSLLDVNGTLYGTTYGGGAYGYYGTVFSISISGTEKVLHSFGGASDGANPIGGLIDVKGTLYGTTENGGAYDSGTVFRISTTGTEKVLHSFGYSLSDGAGPYAGLIDVNDKLYGTTSEGGIYNNGTVFRISQRGKEHVMHSFGYGYDGANPFASLVYVKNRLYGTTIFGGTSMSGTIFTVSTTGKEKVLHDFGNLFDGRYPQAGLIYVENKLYGTTESGGAHKAGTVFSLDMTGTEKVIHSFTGFDGKYPYASLLDVKGRLYGTTYAGGSSKCNHGEACGTIFNVSRDGSETRLHTFGDDSDGASPYASLIRVNRRLYGTTAYGGVHNHNRGGDGTIFSFSL